MMYKKTIVIADQERVLQFKNRQFQKVLMPGKYVFWDWKNELSFESQTITECEFKHVSASILLKNALLAEHLLLVTTSATQAALIYKDGRLATILSPDDQRYYWRDAAQWKVVLVDLNEIVQLDDALLREIIHQGLEKASYNKARVLHVVIPEQHIGLRFEDGQLVETLKPGRYGYWALLRALHVETVDMRLRTEEVSGQEILTKDRVSIRVNLNATYRVTDAVVFTTLVKKADEHIYRQLQLALRAAIGTKTLDELLENKQSISQDVFAAVTEKLSAIGVTLNDIGVKDIILPGDMKDILNQVVEAQKAAEANSIKRREETSATRSLHNTAKLMENNPVLLRLKELESLEKIAERIERIQVVGGLDQVLNISRLLT
ncbi:MAG: slipin family protein [Reinekea sp.]|jgi:regulator of protease activity HflC (stomatin/prohibitin superfamily)